MSESTSKGDPEAPEAAPPGERAWRRMASSTEGKIFIVGIVVLCLYMACVGLTLVWSSGLFQSLLSMTGTHIFGGRAAGMAWGYAHQIKPWLVILANMAIETFLVLLLFPLFVFSYRSLIVIEPLKETIARARRAAETHQRTIMKYGVPGLLLFVWFPFWMTGPLVGSIIGFLIGLRPWVNMCVVLAGTYVAIVCWGLVLQRVHRLLASVGPYVPVVFVAAILLAAVSIHIRYAFWRDARRRDESDEER